MKSFSKLQYKLFIIANVKIKLKIGKGDNVQVISGDDKGKTGVVLKVDKHRHMLTISDINVVKKTVKKQENNNDQNVILIEKPVHISNVKKISSKN